MAQRGRGGGTGEPPEAALGLDAQEDDARCRLDHGEAFKLACNRQPLKSDFIVELAVRCHRPPLFGGAGQAK